MKEYFKRGFISFAISAFCGVLVNLIIDLIVNSNGGKDFVSMSPEFVKLFPTPVIAGYVNVLIYGLIGFTFAAATFIYDVRSIGFLFQNIIYFVITATICVAITMLLWQLHKYPVPFINTLIGYAVCHVIMFIVEYKKVKKDIEEINGIVL